MNPHNLKKKFKRRFLIHFNTAHLWTPDRHRKTIIKARSSRQARAMLEEKLDKSDLLFVIKDVQEM